MIKKTLISSIAGSCLFLWLCTTTPDNIAGNASQTGNPQVVGMIVDANGNPVKGATVRLVPVAFNPHQLAKSLAKSRSLTAEQMRAALLAVADSAVTDSNGQYSFDTVDTGTYNVLADSGATMAFQDSVAIDDPDTQTTVPTDTLKAPGSLRGVVRLQPGHDSRKVFLIALGTFTVTSPADSIGNFGLPEMAEGSYSMRLLSTLDDYGVLDTTFSITAGKTDTLADTIALPYTGIPIPKGLSIAYDTMKQIVTLTWNVPTTGRAVKGYNVYRKHADSTSFVKIAGVIADTVYMDSAAVQDQTYEFKVAAVDTAETEGTKSGGVSVVVVSAFVHIKSFGDSGTSTGQLHTPSDIAVDNQGNFWVVDRYRSKVLKFDTSGAFLLEWGTQGTGTGQLQEPFGIDIGPDQNIYIAEALTRRIQKFDPYGNFIMMIDSLSTQYVFDVSVDDSGYIYTYNDNNTTNDSINKHASSGNLVARWPIMERGTGEAILARNNKVYFVGNIPVSGVPYNFPIIEIFDAQGNLVRDDIHLRRAWETELPIAIYDIDIDLQGNIYAVDYEYDLVRIYLADDNSVITFGTRGTGPVEFNRPRGIAVAPNGTIAVTDDNHIHLFQSRIQ